ncbi:MAG: HPr family phosphocarrier protein [Tissierellia bacterium]|nr:HPr family phosphocarrier protein [Tissierellia bacterium]
MLVRKVILQLETGLHARPASELVKIASGFTSEIVLVKDGQEYNAKSILGLLSIGAGKGDEFIIKAKGHDAQEAIERIEDFLANRVYS